MITNRLDNPELLHTLERAVHTLAAEQNASLTVTTRGHNIDVWVELPDGYEYLHGHTGFGISSEPDDVTHLDVWHDVLVGISYPVVESSDDKCECEVERPCY